MLRGLAACALAGLGLLATATDVRAQTPVTLVSNIGKATSTSFLLGTNDFALAFTTGPYLSGYVVTQVKLQMSGDTATTGLSDVTVTIRTSTAAGRPDTVVGTLRNPGTLGSGIITFTAPRNGIALRRSTTYFIVVDVTGAGLATIDLRVASTNTDAEDSNFDWSLGDNGLNRTRGATTWTSVFSTIKVALVGYERPNPEISGADAHRIRQEICPDDLISTATHHRIFRDQIIVGRRGTTNEYGFDVEAPAFGVLVNQRHFGVARFPRPAGAYDGTLSQSYIVSKITVQNGTLRIRLDKALAAADLAKLEMRVCGHTLKFADATSMTTMPRTTYSWYVNNQVRSALLWNRLNLASLYTGQPVMHPFRGIMTYGTVDVSLGVSRTGNLEADDPPEITGTPALSAAPRTEGTWTSGDTVEATLTFSEAVTVDTTGGTPSVTLQLGGTTEKTAGYLRGSGTTALVFGYTLTDDDGTHTAMVLDPDSLTLNGGTIRGRTSGLDALLAHDGTAVVSPPPPMGTTASRSTEGGEAADVTVTTAEDTAYTFRPSDFGFSDDAKRDRNGYLALATLPGAGALTVDGSPAAAAQVVDKTAIGTGALVFTPAANAHGDAYASFDFRTSSDGFTESAAATLAIDVTPVNDDPAGAPGIAGEAEAGQTATATTGGLSDPDGLTEPGWSYRWLRVADGVETAIEGATASAYVLAAADAGNRIKVEVSYTDDDGTPETVTSAAWPPEGSIAAAPQAEESNADAAGGVTAAFWNAPGTHDGAGEFTVELHFSEEPPLSYKTVQGSLLETANATIRGARRLTPGSNLGWEIRVRPDGAGAITLTLPVRPCAETNAICVDGAALGAAATARIAYAAPPVTQTPLTASFTGMPAGHNGGAFTFELALSEDVRGLGYERVRDSALTVSGGTVTGARRLVRGENRRWEVRVNPGGLGEVTVALAATQDCAASGAICTPEGKKQSTSTGATIRGPALSVADASVEEGSDAELAFTVTLGHAAGRSISVRYATSDGTATAGSDYTATSGTLTFAAGETSKIVSVPVLDDAHDEGAETMTLTLSNPSPSSVALADAAATGTIKNSDPLPQAWLAHFGRTMGSQVLEAVVERTDGGPSGSYFNVGGVSLGGGTPLDAAEPLTPGDWLARQMAAGPQAPRPQERALTGRDLLLGSSFHLVSQAGEDGGGAVWSAWGRVGTGGFRAEVGGVTMDGDVVTGMLGVDAEWERVMAGVLVLRSEADGAYNLLDGDDAGTLDSALTGVYPYARLRFGGRLSVWAVAGIGTGDLTLARAGEPAAVGASAGDLMTRPGETIDTGLDVRLGALGVRGALAAVGGFDLAVKSDVLWVRTASDAVPGLAATSADVNRLRLILEGGRPWTLSSGAVLAPTVQIGLRHDGGDAETGTGVEVGAGFRYSAGVLSVEAQVRTLLAHEAGGYEEWGASGSIRLSPNASGLGPSLAVLPSWGAAGSGVERLWSQPDASALVPGGGVAGPAGRVDAELGWGLAALRGRGVLTPYARLALAEGQDRSWHLGTRLALAESLDLSLEGSRRQAGGGTAHDLTLRATTPW